MMARTLRFASRMRKPSASSHGSSPSGAPSIRGRPGRGTLSTASADGVSVGFDDPEPMAEEESLEAREMSFAGVPSERGLCAGGAGGEVPVLGGGGKFERGDTRGDTRGDELSAAEESAAFGRGAPTASSATAATCSHPSRCCAHT
eukprot:scaffold27521_cov30-Tisochrysis_lutea.AAC.1